MTKPTPASFTEMFCMATAVTIQKLNNLGYDTHACKEPCSLAQNILMNALFMHFPDANMADIKTIWDDIGSGENEEKYKKLIGTLG